MPNNIMPDGQKETNSIQDAKGEQREEGDVNIKQETQKQWGKYCKNQMWKNYKKTYRLMYEC